MAEVNRMKKPSEVFQPLSNGEYKCKYSEISWKDDKGHRITIKDIVKGETVILTSTVELLFQSPSTLDCLEDGKTLTVVRIYHSAKTVIRMDGFLGKV